MEKVLSSIFFPWHIQVDRDYFSDGFRQKTFYCSGLKPKQHHVLLTGVAVSSLEHSAQICIIFVENYLAYLDISVFHNIPKIQIVNV